MGYGVLGGLWVRGEYLAWDMKGMYRAAAGDQFDT